ncbi:YraN family protein [Arthrobacter sp. TWP1-1]|uniref:YraN family protein n=1 Tax=Arthrobacter sp. TWP1-1 TaxID=2804568 RepID=UPI003CE6978C
MRAKDALGQSGEQVAADYLEDRGIRVIDSNWRCSSGEIDIVALDGQELVIVEVKTRRSRRYGDPLEAITRAKLLRLRTLAVLWAREHNRVIGSLRIDAVGIIMDRAQEPSIDHVRGVA